MKVEGGQERALLNEKQDSPPEVLRNVARWLSLHGSLAEQTAQAVGGIKALYSLHVFTSFRSAVTIGVSGRDAGQGRHGLQLSLIWPAEFSGGRALREQYITYLRAEAADKVGRYLPPNLSFSLEFHDAAPKGLPEEDYVRKLCFEEGSEYLGLLDFSVQREEIRRLRGLAEEAQSIWAAAGSSEVDRQVSELLHGLAEKPEEEQRALLQRARRLVA